MKNILIVLFCLTGFISYGQYNTTVNDTTKYKVVLNDGINLELSPVIKITTDNTPIGVDPYQTIVVESTVSWTMLVGDSTTIV